MRKTAVTADKLHLLRPALWGAKGTIKRELATGVSSLYQSSDNNLLMVVRFEQGEMVVVAVVGRNLKSCVGEIITLAKQNFCTSIRFHTKHPRHLEKGVKGLVLTLIEVHKGIFSNEYVFRLEL